MAKKSSKPSLPPTTQPSVTASLISDNKGKILIAVIAVISAILGAVVNGIFGSGVLMTQLLATDTPTLTLTPTLTVTPTIPNPFLEVTAIFQETKRAEQRGTAIAELTQVAGATATQEYFSVLQTVQAEIEATRIHEQAQQQVATEQAQKVEATVQSKISVQQTATVLANQQVKELLPSFASKLSEHPIFLADEFNNNNNGWSPRKDKGYDVSIQNGALQINFSEAKYSPFLWTCDACGSYEKFSYQIDIQTPKGLNGVVAGIVFGSPTRLDQIPFREAYALMVYSGGAIELQRISALEISSIQKWDNRQDLLTSDGKFHTLQVVAAENYVIIYIDGKAIGDVISLEFPATGNIGLVVQTINTNVVYDNLKVIQLP